MAKKKRSRMRADAEVAYRKLSKEVNYVTDVLAGRYDEGPMDMPPARRTMASRLRVAVDTFRVELSAALGAKEEGA
jgi:hypothetical protein